MKSLRPISGIITTLNEEKNIIEAISSLQEVCDEVIVVDSVSTDQTVRLAQEAGAKVVSQQYLGDGIQKNVALSYVKNQWVISIDADERLTPELVSFLRSFDFEHSPYDGISIRRRNYVGSRWVKCCRWYPDRLVRIYRHDKLRFADVKQHARVPSVNVLNVNADLIHYRYRCTGDLFSKPGRNYSSRGAKILYLKGKRVHTWDPVLHGTGAFFVNYFLRGGILGGIDGLSVTLSVSLNSYLKYAKVLEWQRDNKVLNDEDFDSVW